MRQRRRSRRCRVHSRRTRPGRSATTTSGSETTAAMRRPWPPRPARGTAGNCDVPTRRVEPARPIDSEQASPFRTRPTDRTSTHRESSCDQRGLPRPQRIRLGVTIPGSVDPTAMVGSGGVRLDASRRVGCSGSRHGAADQSPRRYLPSGRHGTCSEHGEGCGREPDSPPGQATKRVATDDRSTVATKPEASRLAQPGHTSPHRGTHQARRQIARSRSQVRVPIGSYELAGCPVGDSLRLEGGVVHAARNASWSAGSSKKARVHAWLSCSRASAS